MKYKEMLKKKGGKDSDGASTSEKSDQARLANKQNSVKPKIA